VLVFEETSRRSGPTYHRHADRSGALSKQGLISSCVE
jgi:hypothetical protein